MAKADAETNKEPGALAKAAKLIKERVIQPVGSALGLTGGAKAPTKSQRKAARKAAVAAAHPESK